jgi:ABC-type transport system substrate-binding protein
MSLAPFSSRRRVHRIFLTLIYSLAVGGLLSSMGTELAAQSDGQKPETKKKEEVVDPNAKRPKKAVTVDEDDEPVIKVPNKPQTSESSDLAAALKETKNPVLQNFYGALSVPYDEVTFDNNQNVTRVKPLADYFPSDGGKIRLKGQKLTSLDEDGKPIKHSGGIVPTEADSIVPFEKLAINRIDKFLNGAFDRDPSDKKYVSTEQMLQAASLAMESVAHSHDYMRAHDVRRGAKWDPITKEVEAELLKVHRKNVEYLAANRGWDKTYEFASRIAKDHTKDAERMQIAQPLISLTEKLLEGGNSEEKLKEVQKRLALIELKFPGTAAKSASADQLKSHAEALFRQAKELAGKEGQTQKAIDLMNSADQIWPGLPGLHDERLKLRDTYPVLKVGVRDLPVNFLPGLAATDSERWANELLFESLVSPTYDKDGGQDYVPVLAEARPHLVPMGRQFQLLREIRWSDGRKDVLTGADVVHTAALLKNEKWPAHNPSLGELVEGTRQGKNIYQVTLTLSRGHPDPLTAMTFKILPKDLTPETAARFNTEPVGSGPFMLEKTSGEAASKEVLFLANRFYRERYRDGGKPNAIVKPRIRELHFVKSDDPANDLLTDKLDMIINPPAETIPLLSKSQKVVVDGPLANRRIYFLALNHSNRFLKNQSFRHALANFINRDQLLNDCFRATLGEKVHRGLNGPFPIGSWACNPDAPKKLDDPDNAGLLLKQAKMDLNTEGGKLALKYPNNDPQAKKAMEKLVEQVTGPMGMTFELLPVDPHALREDVEKKKDYDLAYYSYDYPSESYSLGSLLDQNNYFNFRDEGAFELQSLFNQIQNHRDFKELKTLTQAVHDRFINRSMPFIPLWQLDTFIVHTRSLSISPKDIKDPLLVFPGVEDWVLERK